MAQQFVVIWSLFLYTSCLLLCCSNAKVVLPQQQQATKVPFATINNVVEVDGQIGAGGAGGVEGVVVPAASVVGKEERVYHPAAVTKPRIIDQYDHRSLDGHFEYRYLLSNGEARYERAYWLPAGKSMVLARKGYYSYPLSHDKFLTVFYTADQNGYRQDSATYSRSQPTLPRSIEVPEYAPSSVYATQAPTLQQPAPQHVYSYTTTQRPYIQPTGNPFMQFNSAPPVQQTSVNQAAVHQQIGGQGQSLSDQQSQVHHSSGHASNVAHPTVSGNYPSAAHSSHGGQHSSGVYSTSGVSYSPSEVKPVAIPSIPSDVAQPSGVHSSIGVPSISNIISPAGIYPSSVVHSHAGVPSSSPAHASSNVHHSSEIHSHGGAHSSIVPATDAHSSTGGHISHISESSLGAHSSSSGGQHSFGAHSHTSALSQAPVSHSSSPAHSSTSAHTASVVSSHAHSPSLHHSTTQPSAQVHQQYPSAHHSAGVQTTAAPSVPVQSWHYNF